MVRITELQFFIGKASVLFGTVLLSYLYPFPRHVLQCIKMFTYAVKMMPLHSQRENIEQAACELNEGKCSIE